MEPTGSSNVGRCDRPCAGGSLPKRWQLAVSMNRIAQSLPALLMIASGCVLPVRKALPAIDGTLTDGAVAVPGASVRYTWDFSPVACEESSTVALTDAAGHFAFVAERWWGVGVISPFPDVGRSGWQLCFEAPDGRARSFHILAEPRSASVACDLARAETDGVCEVTWR